MLIPSEKKSSSGLMTENDLTEIRIKNMVCLRCELVVQKALEELDLEVVGIELGRAVVKNFGQSLL